MAWVVSEASLVVESLVAECLEDRRRKKGRSVNLAMVLFAGRRQRGASLVKPHGRRAWLLCSCRRVAQSVSQAGRRRCGGRRR